MNDHRSREPGSGVLWLTLGVILVVMLAGLGVSGFWYFGAQREMALRAEAEAMLLQRESEAASGQDPESGRRVHLQHQGSDTLILWEEERRWVLHSRREGLTKVVLGVDLPPPSLDQDTLVVRPDLDVTGLVGLVEVSPTVFHTHVDVARLPDPDELERWCLIEARSFDQVRQALLPSATPDADH